MLRPRRGVVCLGLFSLLAALPFAQDQDKEKIKYLTPTHTGATGLFNLSVADTLRQGEFTFGVNSYRIHRAPGDLSFTVFPVSFTLGLHDRLEFFTSLEAYKQVDPDQIHEHQMRPGGPLLPARLKGASPSQPGAIAWYNDTPFVDVGYADSYGDLLMGFKVNLLSERRGAPIGFAIQPSARFSLNDERARLGRGLTTGVNDAGVDAILSKDLRGGGTLTTNLGMLFVGDVHVVSRQHRVNYGLGFDLPVGSQKSRFIAELVGGKFVGPDDPGMANPRSPIDAYAGMRVFPSRWVAVSGAYSLNLRTIEKNVLGVEQTGRHGWVAQVAVQRKINRSPVVECTTDRRTLIEGESTTIKLNAVDPDDDLLTAEWTSTGGRLTQQGNSVIFDSTGLKPGKYIVTAEVSDGENTAVCSSYEVTVEKKKQPPTIACEPRATAIGDSESTTLRAAASDPNGDALAYAWKVDGQSIPNGQAEFVFGAVGKSPGDHKIQVTVTDVDGLSANCEFTVTVRAKPNQPPTVKLKLDKSEVFAGEVVTAVASARDPDGDPINYVWSMDALPRRETGPQIQINSSGMAGGSHAIAVTVSDGRAQTAAASDTSSFVVREKVVIQVGGLKPDNATKARLDEIGLRLQREPRLKAAITGYTDPPKTAKETVKPSLQRAEGAKDYLVKQHQIDPTRIEVRDGGTANPVGDNSTEAGRKENRRVEIVLSVV